MKRIMVVGARGYVGQAFCRAAQSRGIEVFGASSQDGTGLDPATGMVDARFSIPADTDAVIYLAQSPHYRELPRHAVHLMTVNCVSAIEIARRAAEMGVSRLLYASTGSVYVPALTPLTEAAPLLESAWYPFSKVQAEKALALFRPALDVCAVRIFGIYGPAQTDKLVPNLMTRLRAGQPISLQSNPLDPSDHGGLRISLCHVDDACRAMLDLLAIDSPLPAAVNLGGEAIDMRTLATLLADRLHLTAELVNAGTARNGDLICEGRLLDSLIAPHFRPIAEGLDDVVRASA